MGSPAYPGSPFYTDQDAGLRRFLPVVLPGGSPDDLPMWLAPVSASHYLVTDYSVAGLPRSCTGC